MTSKLIDYEQIIILMTQLENDTSIKKKKRLEITEMRKELQNTNSLLNVIAITSALEEVISPYQLWGQLHDISAAGRLYQRLKMENKIKSLGENLSDDLQYNLKKIDFKQKFFGRSETELTNVPKNIVTLLKKITKSRQTILEKFESHKDKLHEDFDPQGLLELSQMFDTLLYPSSQNDD